MFGSERGRGSTRSAKALLECYRTLAVVCGLLGLWACNSLVVVQPYPVLIKTEKKKSTDTHPRKYLSIHPYVDPDLIMEEFDGGRSTILITADATLPTREGSISFNIPLFSIEDGALKTHAGADLLRRYPIMADSRHQVEIAIQVHYIKGGEAMKTAQSILEKVGGVARTIPSIAQAGEVLTAAVAAIDSATPQRHSPNEYRLSVDAHEVMGSGDVQAFLLLKMQGSNGGGRMRPGEWSLTPCSDQEGLLCASTQDERLAKEIEPEDKDIAQPEKSDESDAGDKPAKNKATPCAERRCRPPCTNRQCDALMSSGDDTSPPCDARRCRLDTNRYLCFEPKADDEESKESAKRALPICDKREVDFPTNEGDTLEVTPSAEQLAIQTLSYAKHRFTEVPYVTLVYRADYSVFDPLLVLPIAGRSCDRLNEEHLKSVYTYLTENELFFHREDVEVARQILRGGRSYLTAREATKSRNVPALMDLLERAGDDLDPITSSFEPSQLLAEQHQQLQSCTRDAWYVSPAEHAWDAWMLYRNPKDYQRTLAQCLDVSPQALRLDALHYALELINRGTSGGSKDNTISASAGSVVHREIINEYASLKEQARERGQTDVQCSTLDTKHMSYLSTGCPECWQKAAKNCRLDFSLVHAHLDKRKEALDVLLRMLAQDSERQVSDENKWLPPKWSCADFRSDFRPLASGR